MHHGRRYESPSSPDSVLSAAPDRRTTPRFELRLAITMQGENNFYAGLSENLSEGGVFIATSHALPIGTPVVLQFTLPTSDAPLTVTGTVKWVRGPDATADRGTLFGTGYEVPGVMPGLGVQFHGVDADAQYAIRAFMEKRSPVFFDA